MKVIVAGSRGLWPFHTRAACNSSPFDITEVVCGGANGPDTDGRVWAQQKNIPVKMFPAEWDKYGKWAGFKRNKEMANYADALIAVWDGSSLGTKHMIDVMKQLRKPVYVYQAS